MTRLTITIRGEGDRNRAAEFVRKAPFGSRIEFKQEKRSSEQNAKMWAALADVAEQVEWHGVRLESEDWKLLFLDALKREVRLVPNIDGNGFVALGRSSSDLTVAEMSDLIELILMFGANRGVIFHEPASNSSGMESPINHQANRTDAPAADSSARTRQAAGVPHSKASLLSDDWRDSYIATMTSSTTKAMSILTRHQAALQMVGEPNQNETAWMREVARLVGRRDQGKINSKDLDAALERLRHAELPIATEAA